jgi:group I intron endonuclease
MKITILNSLKLLTNRIYLNKKAGVYQITNLIDGKTYVGSSVDLFRRLNEYLNPLYIVRNLKKGNSKLLNALLKYGYNNFDFKILEFIKFEPSQSKSERRNLLLNKEQYFINEIKPEYNLNQKAGNNLGRIYSEEVRRKMSLAKIGKPGNKKGAILSLESRALFREKSGKVVGVTMLNENNEILAKYKSIQIASEITGISRNRISRCARGIRKELIENGKVYKFKYSNEE